MLSRGATSLSNQVCFSLYPFSTILSFHVVSRHHPSSVAAAWDLRTAHVYHLEEPRTAPIYASCKAVGYNAGETVVQRLATACKSRKSDRHDGNGASGMGADPRGEVLLRVGSASRPASPYLCEPRFPVA